MQLRKELQPGISVNTCSLVKPAFELRGIHSDYDGIFFPKICYVGDVKGKSRIAAEMMAHIYIIHPDLCGAIHPIESDAHPIVALCFGQGKFFSVPSDAVLRIQTANGFIPMRFYIRIVRIDERKLHDPIVWQLYRFPVAVIKICHEASANV